MRALWDILIDPHFASFKGMLLDQFIGIICDFFPIMILLVFQYHNFNKSENRNRTEGFANLEKEDFWNDFRQNRPEDELPHFGENQTADIL